MAVDDELQPEASDFGRLRSKLTEPWSRPESPGGIFGDEPPALTKGTNPAVCPECDLADIAAADRFGNEAEKTTAGGRIEQAPNVRWSPKDEQPKPTVE